MKQNDWPDQLLFQHLGRYKAELTAFLNQGVTEVIEGDSGVIRMRELRYEEKYALLQEVVRIEQEMRVLSLIVETPAQLHERLMQDANLGAERLKTIAEWRRAQQLGKS